MINLSTNKALIERSVQFEEETLVAVEVGDSSSSPKPLIVSEDTNEFADSDMSNNNELIVGPNIPTRPKWEARTIHAAGEVAGNPNYTRRTRSQFESALCVNGPLFTKKCYLMIYYDPQTYEYASHDPICKTTMK